MFFQGVLFMLGLVAAGLVVRLVVEAWLSFQYWLAFSSSGRATHAHYDRERLEKARAEVTGRQ